MEGVNLAIIRTLPTLDHVGDEGAEVRVRILYHPISHPVVGVGRPDGVEVNLANLAAIDADGIAPAHHEGHHGEAFLDGGQLPGINECLQHGWLGTPFWDFDLNDLLDRDLDGLLDLHLDRLFDHFFDFDGLLDDLRRRCSTGRRRRAKRGYRGQVQKLTAGQTFRFHSFLLL